MRWLIAFVVLTAAVFKLNACSDSSQTGKGFDLKLPNDLRPEVRELITKSWPAVLAHCPGINRYATDLRFAGIDDWLDTYNQRPEMNRVVVRLQVSADPVAIPPRFNVRRHLCHFGIGSNGQSLRIKKSMCVSLCLDRQYTGPTDYVVPLQASDIVKEQRGQPVDRTQGGKTRKPVLGVVMQEVLPWLVLGGLVAIWIGFTVYGFRRGWSATINIGGGFLVACVTFIVVSLPFSIADMIQQHAAQERREALEKTAAEKHRKAAATKRRKEEELRCQKDLQCWGDKNLITASFRCADAVPRLARYAHKWTNGFLEPKLSTFTWLDKSAGTLTYLGDSVQFQNGFGAWQNMMYACDYDPKSHTVLTVRVQPGRR